MQISIKSSSTPGAIPGGLAVGELAINTADKRLWVGTPTGTVVKIIGQLGNQDSNAVDITAGNVTDVSASNSNVTATNFKISGSSAVTDIKTNNLESLTSSDLVTASALNQFASDNANSLKNIISYTSGTNNYTRSGTDVKQLRVICVGAGGGGRGYGESGGAGGYSEEILDADAISYPVSVTIGNGGSGGVYFGISGQGGTTSFGSYLSATGGSGANQNYQHCGGHGGFGSGGNVNMHGGGGAGHKNCHSSSYHNPGHGGQSFFGGSNAGHHFSQRYAQEEMARGSGGAGHNSYNRGGWSAGYNGMTGICVIYEYK